MKFSYLLKAAMLFALLLIGSCTPGCATYRLTQATLQNNSRVHRHHDSKELLRYRKSFRYKKIKGHGTNYKYN